MAALQKDSNLLVSQSPVHQRGLFANTTFKVGDVVLEERPLLVCAYAADQQSFDLESLSTAIAQTAKQDMEAIHNLFWTLSES